MRVRHASFVAISEAYFGSVRVNEQYSRAVVDQQSYQLNVPHFNGHMQRGPQVLCYGIDVYAAWKTS
jgi:hypothetical protein